MFKQGMNEEYGATAVIGSQLASVQPDCRYDGTVGIWYGKSPGVDRATDALRHAGAPPPPLGIALGLRGATCEGGGGGGDARPAGLQGRPSGVLYAAARCRRTSYT